MEGLNTDIVVIGGGLAGLACARTLHRAGRRVFVAEGSDAVGGRIRTDEVDGFLLDRGFQVLHTAYPEAGRALDLEALNLKPFDPGVIIRKAGRFHILADPSRKPRHLLSTALSPVGTIADRLRMLRLFVELYRRPIDSIFGKPDTPTREYLRDRGFSRDIIDSFFSPFFGAVCLDPDIGASSRVFEYIFQMFASGNVAVPAYGMESIPRQIASALPADSIGTGMRVEALTDTGVLLADGRQIAANTIVIATEAAEARRLLGKAATVAYFSEHCVYFDAERPPMPHNLLILNGDGHGPVTNLAILSNASPGYAPPGKASMAAVVIGKQDADEAVLPEIVRSQLKQWFGPAVDGWRHLKTYFIPKALPDQRPPLADPFRTNPRVRENVYVCGEYGSVPGTQWALYTGRKTAESILAERGQAK